MNLTSDQLKKIKGLQSALVDIVKEGPVTRQQDKVRPKLTKSEANELISNLIGTQVDLFAVGSSDPEAGASPSPSPALTPALALALALALF